MAEYVTKEQVIDWYRSYGHIDEPIPFETLVSDLRDMKSSDVAPVRHGRWELTTHSFYRDTFDESCELCIYIVANCSECSGKHPNSYQVFSKTLYALDDSDDGFRFDQKAEEKNALWEFRNKKYEFSHYCPNCGAKMLEIDDERIQSMG